MEYLGKRKKVQTDLKIKTKWNKVQYRNLLTLRSYDAYVNKTILLNKLGSKINLQQMAKMWSTNELLVGQQQKLSMFP